MLGTYARIHARTHATLLGLTAVIIAPGAHDSKPHAEGAQEDKNVQEACWDIMLGDLPGIVRNYARMSC